MQCGTDMQCGGTQTRRQQERRGTPKPGRGAARGASFSERSAPRAPVSGCPAPLLLPSPGLRSDPAQCNKSSPKVTLTQTIPKRFVSGGGRHWDEIKVMHQVGLTNFLVQTN